MAHNLSSNQQYLLSMVQQNNPEILSKFLNEQDGERKKPSLVKDQTNAEKIARETKEAERQASAAEHYKNLFADLRNFDVKKMTPQQAAEVAMYKAMTKKGKIGGESGKKLKAAVETPISDVTSTGDSRVMSSQDTHISDLVNLDDDVLSKISTRSNSTIPSFSTQNKVALRYQKKAEENALPFGDRPISPFYKTTRNEFATNLGRGYDSSGGANPENMRTLVNVKTNLAGRLHDAERDWRDKISYEEQMKAAEKAGRNPLAMMMGTLNAKKEAEKKHKVHNYRISDLDVPPRLQPGEFRSDWRTMQTEPEVDNSSETEWFGADLFKVLGGTPDMLDDNKQASSLSGKSVNQKINRIA